MSANKTYRISCWAKLKGTTGSDTLKLTLRIDDDVDGRKWLGISNTINNQDWTLIQGDIAVNVAGTLTGIDLYAEGPAVGVEYYVDDVSAIEVSSGGRSLESARSSTRPKHEDAEMQAASGAVVSPIGSRETLVKERKANLLELMLALVLTTHYDVQYLLSGHLYHFRDNCWIHQECKDSLYTVMRCYSE
eukprot:scaffold28333_cov83-Skeletonema_dohrnii-CCMP3373.AAC.1